MKKRVKRLNLNRETLTAISQGSLGEVAGGTTLLLTEALTECRVCRKPPPAEN